MILRQHCDYYLKAIHDVLHIICAKHFRTITSSACTFTHADDARTSASCSRLRTGIISFSCNGSNKDITCAASVQVFFSTHTQKKVHPPGALFRSVGGKGGLNGGANKFRLNNKSIRFVRCAAKRFETCAFPHARIQSPSGGAGLMHNIGINYDLKHPHTEFQSGIRYFTDKRTFNIGLIAAKLNDGRVSAKAPRPQHTD